VKTEIGLGVAGFLCLASLVVQAGEGAGWKCQGNQNCASTTCVNPPNYSCAEVTPVNHPKCEYTGTSSDNCKITQRACLKRTYYAGGNCSGTPSACPHAYPWNISDYLCEDGCGTETQTCARS
jgi:hypothetical protein